MGTLSPLRSPCGPQVPPQQYLLRGFEAWGDCIVLFPC